MPLSATLTELHGMLAALHPALLVGLAALAVSLETSLFVGLLFPGDLMLLLAGTTVTSPSRFVAVLVAGLVGSLVGESVGYALGRRYGYRLRRSRLGRKLGEHRWVRATTFLNRTGLRAIVLARFMPGVHAIAPVVAGTVRYPFGRFIRWCALAAVGWSAVYVGLGAFAGAHISRIDGSMGMLGYGLLAVVGVVWVVRGIVRRRARVPVPAQARDRAPVPASVPVSVPVYAGGGDR